MSRNLILGIVVVLIVIAGGWWLVQSQSGQNNPSPTDTSEATPVMEPSSASPSGSPSSSEQTVTITSDGFNPTTVTIKEGEMVTWMNSDSSSHTVNSDTHPSHTLFPILNTVGLVKSGEKKSLTFDKTGTYTYHDHLNSSLKGTIIVQ